MATTYKRFDKAGQDVRGVYAGDLDRASRLEEQAAVISNPAPRKVPKPQAWQTAEPKQQQAMQPGNAKLKKTAVAPPSADYLAQAAKAVGQVTKLAMQGIRHTYDWQASIPLRIRLATLSGVAIFMTPGDMQLEVAPTPEAVKTLDVQEQAIVLNPVQLPYDAAAINDSLAAFNAYQYAPGQTKKVDAIRDTQFEIDKIKESLSKSSAADAELKLRLTEKQAELAALPQPKVNDKLTVLNGAKWAILTTPRSVFTHGLKGVASKEVFGLLMAKGRIEGLFTPDAEYSSDNPDHARGPVQLETPAFVTLLARHYQKLRLPKNERHAFDNLLGNLSAVMDDYASVHYPDKDKANARKTMAADQTLMMAALNAASPARQSAIREALLDPTPMNLFGQTTTRGTFISYFLAQFFIDEIAPPNTALATQYGANTPAI